MQHPDELKKEIEILMAENRRLREQQTGAPRDPAMTRDEMGVVLDGAGAGILVLDASMRILFCNRKLSEIFQVEEPDVLGRTCRAVICRGNSRSPLCVFEKVMASGQGESRTDWIFGERCFEVVATPIRAAGGEIEKVVLVYTEVTDRKRTEHALQRSLIEAEDARQKVDAILRSIADGLLVTDLFGRIVLMNPAAEAMLELPFRRIAGRPLKEVVADPVLENFLENALREQEPFEFDMPLTAVPGSRVLRGHVSLFHSRQGKATGKILILHEVTREREIEKMKREFVSTAGHELQTPLTAIVGFSELLLNQDDLPEETRRECLTFILEKGEALSALVDRLLDINRIDAGRPLALNPEPFSARQLIDGAVACFSSDEQSRCTVRLPAAEVTMRGDREKMTRTLENLISNALKFSSPENTVEISCELSPAGLRMAVHDQGVGMTPEQTERIFEAFYRGDSSNTSSGGAGLGMCLVKHVVEAHGGTVEIESAPGDGTLVTLMLPGENFHAA